MNTCPTPAQLQQWLDGTLAEAQTQWIEAHVKICAQVCQPLLASLSGREDVGTTAPEPAQRHAAQPVPKNAARKRDQSDAPALPGYDILGPLGRGGMGVVYKARHRRMARLVAIKVLPPNLVQDATAVARFEREVQAAARLHHPNIVTAYDAAEAGGVHFFVMEYIDGTDLSALVKRHGPLPVRQAVDCVLQAARGLDYAHRHNVVHRDVKPGNLLLDHEGVLKVLDMGLARLDASLGGEVTELTGAGQIMGTIDYMAPEQAVDTHHADARADVYSLGMTLWYLLTGRPAYKQENTVARLLAHREDPIPGLCDACPPASAELECVFERMVAKRPEERYQSMAELIAALENCAVQMRSAEPPSTFIEPGSSSDQRRAMSGVGVAEPVVAEPVLSSAVTLHGAELDTNPNALMSASLAVVTSPPPRKRGNLRLLVGVALALFGAMFGAYTIRVQTGEGEVVVESEVDGISVDIVRNGEPGKGDWQIKAGPDNRRHVRTGTVEVKLPANLEGELSIDQDSTRLVRDGKILVRITRKQKAIAVAASAEKGEHVPSRNREVAEWVIEHGGSVSVIKTPETPAIEVHTVGELPAGHFRFWSVQFDGEPAQRLLEDEFLAQMERVDGGVSCLWGVPLTDKGMAILARNPRLAILEGLSIGGHNAIGPDAALALARMTGLRDLNIAGTRITSSSLKSLQGLPSLDRLKISSQQVDDSWNGLLNLSALRTLVVTDEIKDEALGQLGDLPQLRSVALLGRTEISPQIVAEFERKNPMCRILVGGAKVAGRDHERETAERLAKRGARLTVAFLPDRIRSEDVNSREEPVLVVSVTMPHGCEIGAEELDRLSSLTEIGTFNAIGLRDADRCAKAFDEQRFLAWYIGLAESDLTDTGLIHLAKLPGLGTLNVQRTKVTAAGVEEFRAARPDCKVVWEAAATPVGNSEHVPSNNRRVAEWVLKHGGWVDVISRPGMPAARVQAIDEMPAGDFQLWCIWIGGEAARSVSENELLTQLGRIEGSALQRLCIHDLALTRDGLTAIAYAWAGQCHGSVDRSRRDNRFPLDSGDCAYEFARETGHRRDADHDVILEGASRTASLT